jgi:VWFA-related protein
MRLLVSSLTQATLRLGLCALLPGLMNGAASQPNSAPVSDLTEGLINLDVVVTDTAGKPVSGLRLADFRLAENGQPNKILSFHSFDGTSAQPKPPVEVILLLDTLNLPRELANHERDELERYLSLNDGQLSQPTAIFGLSEGGARWIAQSSQNGKDLAAAVAANQEIAMVRPLRDNPAAPFIGAADPPALTALKTLGAIATAERQVPGRKLLVWVGPGWSAGSSKYFEGTGTYHEEYLGTKKLKQNLFDRIYWFSALLRESRIALYALSAGETPPSARPDLTEIGGVKSLTDVSSIYLYREVLAVQSGGRVLPPDNDLAGQINSCVKEAGIFSTLSFDPMPADRPHEYHSLKVLIDKPGLTARTTTGYYDEPFYSDQPNRAGKRVTADQLGHLLSAAHGEREGEVVRQLSQVEVSERISAIALASWAAELRGRTARQMLVAIADATEFLDPPASEILPAAPPDESAQRRIVSLAAGYLHSTMSKLPNYYARRIVARFEETPQYDEGSMHVQAEPLHLVATSKATVLYRDGAEVVSSGGKDRQRDSNDHYLITYGTFGPLLNAASDAMTVPGGLSWGRWEKGTNGARRAIFRYQVPASKSRYQAGGCCLPDGNGTIGFARRTGYHGEVAVDPESGALLRLQLEADLQGFVPLNRSEIMIAYGPVEIGGKTYICPVRSVSIWRARSVPTLSEWDESFRTWGPYATMLNDISFDRYHMFRSESRLVPGFSMTP